jgi:hypothetical protein
MERINVEEFLSRVLEDVEGLSEELMRALQQAAKSAGNSVESIKRAIREGTRG